MISKKNNSVVIGIVGGIGNQLFQYYAGKYLAMKYDSDLILDFGNHGVAGTKHLGTLRDLDFGAPLIESQAKSSPLNQFAWRAHQKIAREFPLFGKLSTKYFGLYQSNVIGYDPALENLLAPISIRGYFQTWRYFDSLHETFKQAPAVKNPSDWYESNLKEISRLRPIGIHIRRGDYESQKETFGVLDIDYYDRALKILDATTPERKIYVFSDDVDKSQAILASLKRDFIYIDPPGHSNPIESMILMSKTSGLVMANSSFSWWAAKFGDPKQMVIAPSKWFRGLQDPSELIPSHWHVIESSWE